MCPHPKVSSASPSKETFKKPTVVPPCLPKRGKFRDHPQRAFLVYKLISIILGIIYRLSPTCSFMRATEGTSRSNDSLIISYSSKSLPKISCQGSPCLLSSSMKGSGSNSSTLYTPAFFQSPCMKRRAPIQAGTPVV